MDKDEKAYHAFLQTFKPAFLTARELKLHEDYGTFMYPETYIIDAKGKVLKKIAEAADWQPIHSSGNTSARCCKPGQARYNRGKRQSTMATRLIVSPSSIPGTPVFAWKFASREFTAAASMLWSTFRPAAK